MYGGDDVYGTDGIADSDCGHCYCNCERNTGKQYKFQYDISHNNNGDDGNQDRQRYDIHRIKDDAAREVRGYRYIQRV
jgi:hypothetical protein